MGAEVSRRASLATARSSATAASRPSSCPNRALPATRMLAPAATAPGAVSDGDPTVDLDARRLRPAAGSEQIAELGDLRLHRREVALAAEARVDGHHEDDVDEVEDVGDGGDGRRRVDRHAGGGAELGDVAERAVQVRARLGVDDQPGAAGFDVARGHHVGGEDHQVGLERQRDTIPHGGDDVGTERQVGDELAVHHVPLDEVDAGLLEGDDLVAEPREVRREHRRGDLDRQCHGTDRSTVDVMAFRAYACRAGRAPVGSWLVARSGGRFKSAYHAAWQRCSSPDRFAAGGRRSAATTTVASCSSGVRCRARPWSAEIIQEKRDWARAHVVDIVDASPDRVTPPCASRLAGCGGCGWMHLDLDAQRRAKAAIVEEALRRTGGIADAETVLGPGVDREGYRTTARVRRRAWTAPPGSGPSGPTTSSPLPHCLVSTRRCARSDRLRCASTPASRRRCGCRWRRARSAHDGTASGERPRPAASRSSGERGGRSTRTSPGSRLRVSIGSFFQSGPQAADAARRRRPPCRAGARRRRRSSSTPTPESGMFAACATADDSYVVAIETSRSAVADARENLVGRATTSFAARSAAGRPPRISESTSSIADPARSGLGGARNAPRSPVSRPVLVLVSCDPGSLGRDAKLLGQAGYVHERSELIDTFPQTTHIEVVSRFTRSEGADAVTGDLRRGAHRPRRRRPGRRPRVDDLLQPRPAVAGQRRGTRTLSSRRSERPERSRRSRRCSTVSPGSGSTPGSTSASSVRHARRPSATSPSPSPSAGTSGRRPSAPRSPSLRRPACRCSPPVASVVSIAVPRSPATSPPISTPWPCTR